MIINLNNKDLNNFSRYIKNVHNFSDIVGYTMVKEEEWDKITYFINKINEIQTINSRKTRKNRKFN